MRGSAKLLIMLLYGKSWFWSNQNQLHSLLRVIIPPKLEEICYKEIQHPYALQ